MFFFILFHFRRYKVDSVWLVQMEKSKLYFLTISLTEILGCILVFLSIVPSNWNVSDVGCWISWSWQSYLNSLKTNGISGTRNSKTLGILYAENIVWQFQRQNFVESYMFAHHYFINLCAYNLSFQDSLWILDLFFLNGIPIIFALILGLLIEYKGTKVSFAYWYFSENFEVIIWRFDPYFEPVLSWVWHEKVDSKFCQILATIFPKNWRLA